VVLQMVLVEVLALAAVLHLLSSSSGKSTSTVGSNRGIYTNNSDEGKGTGSGDGGIGQ